MQHGLVPTLTVNLMFLDVELEVQEALFWLVQVELARLGSFGRH